MIERAEGGPLDELRTAIQAFSNALADTPDEVGVVTNGLVVWDEVNFGEDGTQRRATLYAAIG